jgi:pyridoxal phosphate enzyme (YggS family)
MATPDPDRIAENLCRVRGAIAEAALRRGRRPEDVRLVAVTKSVDVPEIVALLRQGQTLLAENRVQALQARVPAVAEASAAEGLSARPTWHMIGNLQRNKVKAVLPLAELIHSVNSLRLAEEIDKRAGERGVPAAVLLEINISGEESKEGLPAAEAEAVIERVAAMPNLRPAGLMTMAPYEAEPEATRPVFAGLRELFGRIRSRLPAEKAAGFCELSMGMSNDYPVAVEEGATLVRVGTALFE